MLKVISNLTFIQLNSIQVNGDGGGFNCGGGGVIQMLFNTTYLTTKDNFFHKFELMHLLSVFQKSHLFKCYCLLLT